jgi:hypothetical protein
VIDIAGLAWTKTSKPRKIASVRQVRQDIIKGGSAKRRTRQPTEDRKV